VGDRAEYRSVVSEPQETGTINIVLLTDAALTPAAMVEAVQMITEAKTSALMADRILSPVSGQLASGTGTDAVVVVSGQRQETVAWCGKHVLFGEVLGALTLQAVADSISWYRCHSPTVDSSPSQQK
jgi:adenosylcobinamide amidohydrolase